MRYSRAFTYRSGRVDEVLGAVALGAQALNQLDPAVDWASVVPRREYFAEFFYFWLS